VTGRTRASRARRVTVAALSALTIAATACSSGSTGSAAGGPTGSGSTRLTVLAAASLTEAFGRIGRDFESAHRGVTVAFSFGPSDGLATQIQNGVPADVYACASETWMDAVQKHPGVRGRADFARNRLLIITPKDNPAGIASIQDLGTPGVKLVLAAKDVPAGTYGREALDNAGIARQAEANVVSNEEDVKGVVQKVLLGEADAGIVYVTDLTQDVVPDVHTVEIPKDVNVVGTYPIAVVSGSEQTALAKAFTDYVLGAAGQKTLRSFGFMPPP
jgi:molybdate transport system substrate-binding protein